MAVSRLHIGPRQAQRTCSREGNANVAAQDPRSTPSARAMSSPPHRPTRSRKAAIAGREGTRFTPRSVAATKQPTTPAAHHGNSHPGDAARMRHAKTSTPQPVHQTVTRRLNSRMASSTARRCRTERARRVAAGAVTVSPSVGGTPGQPVGRNGTDPAVAGAQDDTIRIGLGLRYGTQPATKWPRAVDVSRKAETRHRAGSGRPACRRGQRGRHTPPVCSSGAAGTADRGRDSEPATAHRMPGRSGLSPQLPASRNLQATQRDARHATLATRARSKQRQNTAGRIDESDAFLGGTTALYGRCMAGGWPLEPM